MKYKDEVAKATYRCLNSILTNYMYFLIRFKLVARTLFQSMV